MKPACLADFAGNWRLARRIDDRHAGVSARMEGTALFRWRGGVLVCAEAGRLFYGENPPFEATRVYLWREDGAGRIAVDYEDGRPFHAFSLGPRAAADHLCTPDRYKVEYDFSAWPRWRATWEVRGPRKDYTSITDFEPA